MKRIPLPAGARIQSDSFCFFIDSVLGSGANCIVYNAHYDDGHKHQKEVIIKECYPARSSVSRKEKDLLWDSNEEMQTAFDRMKRSYNLASEIQNSDVTRSASVYNLEKISANGTQYIIMIPQNGQSYDKEDNTDIADIIRTVLALCNAVGLYHRAGYLHLDIKPSNFIAANDHTGKGKNIALFDLDTLVAMDDMENAMAEGISYTKEWAAPEQKQMQIAKLCPATDLYAIGAVLFERIMHRIPVNADMSPFAVWEYDDRFNAKIVNPKAKHLLTDIFHKTLSANVKRRYQSADDLANALKDVLDIVCSKAPYIISSIPAGTCKFVGRTEELTQLENTIKSSDSVFINGSGGIGKTELVKQFISLHKDEYDAVVFMVYNTTVTECLNGVTIYGDIGLDNEKINILKQLCNKNTLLVLDNFDVSLEKGNEVNSLLELQSKVIITTRTDFSDIYPYSRFLTLYGLPVVELKKVFENESGLSLSADDENELSSIYHLGESCTYFWTLVARLTGTGAYSISEIVNKILSGLDDLDESEKVLDTKDGLHIKRTVAKAMSNLFKLEGFEQEEYETLESLYYLDRLNLSKRQIKDVFALCNSVSGHKLMNVFNNLLEKGYIERYQYRKNDAYRINDVLKNVIEYELNPVLCRSKVLTPFIENKLFAHKTWLSSIEYDDTAEQDNASYRFKCLFSILQRINWTNQNDAEYSVNLIYDMIGGEAHAAGYAYNDYSSEVFRSIIKYAMDQNANPIIRLKAFVIICSWSCHWIQTTLFEAFDDIKRRHIKDAEMYFGNAIEIIDNNKISDETLMNDLCRPFVGAFMRSNSTAKYEMFSGCLIEKILSMDPVCIRNAEVIPWKSFKIRCLLNKEYEAIYLKDAIKKLTSMDADDAEQFAYITIGRILLNGGMVSVIVSEQLRQLRIEVFKYCIARFFDCENGNSLRLDDIDPSDFAPYSLGLPKSMTIGEGIERFMYSLLENISEMVYEAKRQKSIEEEKFDLMTNEHNMWGSDFPILFNEKGEYDIGLFINAISPEMSSDNLNYIVQEYWGIVDQMLTPLSLEERLLATIFDCDDDEEKDKYIGVADLLQECLESMVNKDRFEPTYDRWSMSQIVKDSYCIETEIESIKAVIYAKRYDRRNLDVCMKKVLCHSDEYLFSLNDDDIIDYEHGMDCDVCFWYAFNRIRRLSGYGDFLLSLLIDYSHVVENHFNVGNEPDARMYNYYKEIVEVANCALKEESAWNSLIKTDDSDLCDDKTNHIREIIDTYSVLLERLSGQEYHP